MNKLEEFLVSEYNNFLLDEKLSDVIDSLKDKRRELYNKLEDLRGKDIKSSKRKLIKDNIEKINNEIEGIKDSDTEDTQTNIESNNISVIEDSIKKLKNKIESHDKTTSKEIDSYKELLDLIVDNNKYAEIYIRKKSSLYKSLFYNKLSTFNLNSDKIDEIKDKEKRNKKIANSTEIVKPIDKKQDDLVKNTAETVNKINDIETQIKKKNEDLKSANDSDKESIEKEIQELNNKKDEYKKELDDKSSAIKGIANKNDKKQDGVPDGTKKIDLKIKNLKDKLVATEEALNKLEKDSEAYNKILKNINKLKPSIKALESERDKVKESDDNDCFILDELNSILDDILNKIKSL